MENPIKRKINIFGKVAKIITTIIIVFLLVAEGFLLTGGVIVAALPEDSVTVDAAAQFSAKVDNQYFGIDEGRVDLNAGGGKISIGEFSTDDVEFTSENGKTGMNAAVSNLHFDLNDALLLIVFAIISLAAIIVALFFFKALMKQFMVCDSPFCDGVVQKMKNFAIALIPCLAVGEGMKAAMNGIISDSFTMNVDLVSVAFVFIIFVLTMIFKYGTQLQKEHDETV